MSALFDSIRAADCKFDKARAELCEAIEAAFPPDAVVDVTCASGRGPIRGIVINSDESRVYITNIDTGKKRHFYPTMDDCDARVVAFAKKKASK